jgi:hypothetical protein
MEDTGINTKYSDYGSAFLYQQTGFASARDTGSLCIEDTKWTNQKFLPTSYVTDLGEDLSTGRLVVL